MEIKNRGRANSACSQTSWRFAENPADFSFEWRWQDPRLAQSQGFQNDRAPVPVSYLVVGR